jgi:hypothetical protein
MQSHAADSAGNQNLVGLAKAFFHAAVGAAVVVCCGFLHFSVLSRGPKACRPACAHTSPGTPHPHAWSRGYRGFRVAWGLHGGVGILPLQALRTRRGFFGARSPVTGSMRGGDFPQTAREVRRSFPSISEFATRAGAVTSKRSVSRACLERCLSARLPPCSQPELPAPPSRKQRKPSR